MPSQLKNLFVVCDTNMFQTKCSIKKEEAIARLLLPVHTPTRPLLGFLCLLASLPPSMPLSPTASCSDFSCCSPYTSLLLPKSYYYTLVTHDRQRTARVRCVRCSRSFSTASTRPLLQVLHHPHVLTTHAALRTITRSPCKRRPSAAPLTSLSFFFPYSQLFSYNVHLSIYRPHNDDVGGL